MDCLRSFIVSIDQVTTFSGTDVKTWFVGAQEFWVVEKSGVSTFVPEGFKNIDIYGVDVIGNVSTQKAAGTGGVVVQDWGFELLIEGQLPLVSGTITTSPNFWNIQTSTTGTKTFALSKNTNSLKFADPIGSVKNINFEVLRAQGVGGQTAGVVSLDWDLSFVFFYKYEGE
jgi:hypothetical protein